MSLCTKLINVLYDIKARLFGVDNNFVHVEVPAGSIFALEAGDAEDAIARSNFQVQWME
jgi:hypothetical protein